MAARARVAALVAQVEQAHAARDAAPGDPERRAAEAELRLQRAALEQARTDLAQLENFPGLGLHRGGAGFKQCLQPWLPAHLRHRL